MYQLHFNEKKEKLKEVDRPNLWSRLFNLWWVKNWWGEIRDMGVLYKEDGLAHAHALSHEFGKLIYQQQCKLRMGGGASNAEADSVRIRNTRASAELGRTGGGGERRHSVVLGAGLCPSPMSSASPWPHATLPSPVLLPLKQCTYFGTWMYLWFIKEGLKTGGRLRDWYVINKSWPELLTGILQGDM